jgi:DNA primase
VPGPRPRHGELLTNVVTIPAEKIAEIRDRVDIEAVVGRSVRLQRKGRSLMGCCPFHGEKTPSFSVDPVKKLFHCFGCGVGGDVFSFVMRQESIDFPEAVRMLAREVGVELPEREESPAERRVRQRREQMYRVNDIARAHFEASLTRDERARAYLRDERGLSDETVRRFRLGFATEAWDELARHLSDLGVPAELPTELGLLGRRSRDGSPYDRLRAKLVFPITLPSGEVAGFGARRADWLVRGEDGGPKYLNSIDSPIYDKSALFYGLDLAKDSIRRAGRALMVEGYFDVILLHQAGIAQAIACCGTALSPKHARALTRLTDTVVTVYDGDRAGVTATRRAAETLLAAGVDVRCLFLPDGHDPDTLVREEGAEAFAARVDAAPSALDAFLERAIEAHHGAGVAGLVAIVEDVRSLLMAVPDRERRALLAEGVAQRLRIHPQRILSQLSGRPPAPVEPTPPPPSRGPADDDGPRQPLPSKREAAVLRMLVDRPPEVLAELERLEAVEVFVHPAVHAAVQAALAARSENGPYDAHVALEAARAIGASEPVLAALRRALVEALPEAEDLHSAVAELLRQQRKRRLRELKNRLARETDPDAVRRLVEQANALARLDRDGGRDLSHAH